MRYAKIEDGVISNVILAESEKVLQELFLLGAFPDYVYFVPCPEGYSVGDFYEAGSFQRKDGSEVPTAGLEAAPVPTTEEDLMAMGVVHEYRLTLLELGVV